ncbi:hypothetical protein [Escherichia coli]|uniref:hypothetical protein n=1 Tax=Escherichia coli TaxID=562 RepID=UPI001160E9B2|nr:hypothetical protein [Escherichia coli]
MAGVNSRVATALVGCTAPVLKSHTHIKNRGAENSLYFTRGTVAKWHLNRSQFGIRIDHDLASISDHSLASQSITIWHASDH